MSSTHSDRWRPTAAMDVLQLRAELLLRLRTFFRIAGYWEVETPLLSRETCIDAWLNPFDVLADGGVTAYLQTSPEFAMKRLLCAGTDSIFQVTRSFRRDERGPLHNAEFTIVEWYRRNIDHRAQMDFVEQLVNELAPRFRGPFHRLSYEESFVRFGGVSPFGATTQELVELARRRGVSLPPHIDHDRDGILNVLLTELIEPELKRLGAVFLYDYPASQAALARIRAEPFPVAERFELYLDGIEICNGYHELTDAEELQRRMERHNVIRVRAGLPLLPVDSLLLEGMRTAGLPACAGVALGFDRLVLASLEKRELRDVMAFPFDHT